MKKIKFNLSGVEATGTMIKQNHHTVWVKVANSFKHGFGRIIKRHIIKHSVKGV